MRKSRLIVILLLLLANCCSSQTIKSVKITDLQAIIANSKTPLIVNFWATWCKPCVEEIPYFQTEVLQHQKDSVQLILVSLDFKEDYPNQIKTFINDKKLVVPVLWLNETNADYFCPKIDTRWSGAIPATLFINNKTGYRNFFEQQLSPEELQREIMAILQ